MPPEFLEDLQLHIATQTVESCAIGTLGPERLEVAAIDFLTMLDLKLACIASDEGRFRRNLGRFTESLLQALPEGGRHWGIARKLLNTFFRDCLYSHYMRQSYELARLEEWMEIPVDKDIARALKDIYPKKNRVPDWTSLIELTPEDHDRFQLFARDHAAKQEIACVHLAVILA